MRMATARKMNEARTIPHFYVQSWCDVTALAAGPPGATTRLRQSPDDLIIHACAVALAQHPQLLSSWMDGVVRRYSDINIGFAVQTEYGLVVPVIRNADRLDPDALSAQLKHLVEKARARRLSVDDLNYGTFTITNLGVFDVTLAWPLINPPQAAILAIGRAAWRPAWRGGGFEPRLNLGLTLGADHRVVDGAYAAHFLETLKATLEAER
jgi:pyruvate dehydrogenase E2 component (dihydrolipoamide acetyltransferase)